ncbi:LysM peptidoglycan-binding domain-containing protein [Paenibacillus frigoriresistens]|uniref:LysM peptidoglycan-binding domain-containing protein n=1 Tax=Paenibacillus alginolyticus TaxID=59839 RepID=UPI0015630948|nr:LysM peptidoglycan-binding domain-containing protein [Paenibacillus frigoriresistens]NRF91414.1 LysM peptidoglycan-binding domain-containing protein [Paenibacillus frigoriresistens]
MKIHIVKKGDTLYELAKKYQTTLDEVIALNPQIAQPDHLDIGMKVKIPSKPKPVGPPVSDYVYKHVVEQGDSLWKLGKAWDVPLQEMIKANPHLKNPNVLMTGEIVYVPKMHHDHVEAKPLPMSKASTEPFAPVPSVQPWTVEEPYQQPFMPVVQEPINQVPSTPYVESMPLAEQPFVPSPMASEPVIPAPEPGVIGLNAPYEQQAVHPFKQFHIKATEVFAYPGSEQQEVPTYPAISPYQQSPYEQFPHHAEPTSYPMSQDGCGCGGHSMIEHPWTTFPAGYPTGTVESPWDGYQHGFPTVPGLYPPAAPYDMQHTGHNPYEYQQAPYDMQQTGHNPYDYQQAAYGMQHTGHNPYDYQQAPYGIPYAGAHYQAPYESPIMPQVHTHELAQETDTEEVVEIDIRKDKKANRSSSGNSSKKVKLSGTEALNAFLKRQQRASEKQEAKQNSPWINV